jgi:thiosulfate/3-mercaptopyruvate sulfurtransferase
MEPDPMTDELLPLLVETDWLEAHLDDPTLRILDATVFYITDPDTGDTRVVPAVDDWERAHIPGSSFVNLATEVSDTTSPLRFALPSAAQFAEAMSRHGVGPGTRVVIYDANHTIWATRLWWLLRTFGFDHAAVLNGGWTKWTLEGRPVTSEKALRPSGAFVAQFRPELIATREEVIADLQDGGTCILNALPADSFREQRIPGSVSVPYPELMDADTGAFLPLDRLKQRFDEADVLNRNRVLVYCGVGISATTDAFLLTLLNARNVAVYDGSMQEWTADSALPVERG